MSVTYIRSVDASAAGGHPVSWMWFDVPIPFGYGGGSGLTVNIVASLVVTGGNVPSYPNCWLTGFGMTSDGGTIGFPPFGTAPVGAVGPGDPGGPGETFAPGSELLFYAENVDEWPSESFNLPRHLVTEIPSTISITIPGHNQGNWNSTIFPGLATSGGGTAVDGAIVPGGIPNLGFFRYNASGYGGLGPVLYGTAAYGAALPSSGLTNATGINSGFELFVAGDTISIGIFGWAAGSQVGGSLYLRIHSIDVDYGPGNINIPITDCMTGFGTQDYFPFLYDAEKFLDHTYSTTTYKSFFLETVVPPPTIGTTTAQKTRIWGNWHATLVQT